MYKTCLISASEKTDLYLAMCWQRYCRYTVRLLTHVLCNPTHFFLHSFLATMSYSLQTCFSSVMKDWADKYHAKGTPTRSSSRSNLLKIKNKTNEACL